MRNAVLNETKVDWKNINNLRYTDETTLMGETEELNSLMMKVKEECGKKKMA